MCDLTGIPRQSEIRYVCDSELQGATYIVSISVCLLAVSVINVTKEAPSCTYTVIVKSSELCKHPSLATKTAPANVIICATERPPPGECGPYGQGIYNYRISC